MCAEATPISIFKSNIAHHEAEIASNQRAIKALQASCDHDFKFVKQVNDYHKERWNVHWECAKCELKNIARAVPPICPTCLCNLHAADADDAEAEKLRVAVFNQSCCGARAFRCPTCKTAYALPFNGD